MRERLLANLRKLPQIVEGWNGPEDNDVQPSQFSKAVTKVLMFTWLSFLENAGDVYLIINGSLSCFSLVTSFYLCLFKLWKIVVLNVMYLLLLGYEVAVFGLFNKIIVIIIYPSELKQGICFISLGVYFLELIVLRFVCK